MPNARPWLAPPPALAAAALVAAVAGTALAQPEAAQPETARPEPTPPLAARDRPVRYRVDLGTTLIMNSEFDDEEGDVTIYRSGAGFAVGIPVGDRANLDLDLGYEHSGYRFDDATGFIEGVDEPWDDVHRVWVSAIYGRQQTREWGWFLGATGSFAGEEGAEFSESLTGGVLGGFRYAVRDNFTIGLGAAVRTRLEDSALVLPVVQINWQINDQWSLSTAGQPGLTLAYHPFETWTFTLSGGWEFRNFRLDEDGPLPGGAASDQRFPIALGAVWEPAEQIRIGFGGGVYLGQSFEVRDEDGDEIADIDADPAPFITLQLSYRF